MSTTETERLAAAMEHAIATKQRVQARIDARNGARKFIETDVADAQSQITALRADVTALAAQVETLSRMIAGLAQDVSEFRSFAKGVPQPSERWWEWVDERIAAEIGALFEDTERGVGYIADKVRIELDETASEIALLKRELGVLRGEVGVEPNSASFAAPSRKRSVWSRGFRRLSPACATRRRARRTRSIVSLASCASRLKPTATRSRKQGLSRAPRRQH